MFWGRGTSSKPKKKADILLDTEMIGKHGDLFQSEAKVCSHRKFPFGRGNIAALHLNEDTNSVQQGVFHLV